ncbi:hypothetical protein NE237_001612 [Protea cynaroides]|uniref:Uncharacterized protein n=1 Tax=Protea cynaroides TaxID=273540 RepID=A0A9Q0KUH1_9MAGN|nr:hypothetical protein NE237_001612 [Protea cynaroides]
MAKSSQALLIVAVCFIGLLGSTYSHEDFEVVGKVYCDTCRAMFETPISIDMVGAEVKLECRSRENGTITATIEGATDDSGKYKLIVPAENHEEDICEVTVLKSTVPECDEYVSGRDRARVVLSHESGLVSSIRIANSLGFLKKVTLPECPEVLKQLGLLPHVKVGL